MFLNFFLDFSIFRFLLISIVLAAPKKKIGQDIHIGDTYHPWESMENVPVHVSSDEHLIAEYLHSQIAPGDSIQKAVTLFEQFSNDNHLGMTLGDEKGAILEKAVSSISDRERVVFLEFGSHIGDGTLRILNALGGRDNCVLFSFESSPEWLGIGMNIVRHAIDSSGNKCKYIPLMLTKDITDICQHIKEEYGQIDGIFFDHVHSKFLRDIQIIRDMNMMDEGTVVVADNALRHRSVMREFIEYMQRNSKKISLEYVREPYPDEVLVSVWKQGISHGDEL